MATNREYVEGLAKRYNVAYEQGDTDKLDEYGRGAIKYRELQNDPNANWQQSGISSPDEYENFKKALETQYKQRGANSTGSGGGTTPPPTQAPPPTQSWNDAGVSAAIQAQTGLISQQMAMLREQQAAAAARDAEQKTRRDALYGELMSRAQQGTQIDANDPIIKGQVDAFRNEQTRAKRDYLSDVAEASGPIANLRGEQRMAAEKTGQAVGGFQAELLGRELMSRRAEIENALNSARGLLTAEQQAGLTREMSLLDNQMQSLGLSAQNTALTSQNALGFAGLDLNRTLGLGQLALGRRGQDLSMDQFLRELALREWDLGNQNDFRWASL